MDGFLVLTRSQLECILLNRFMALKEAWMNQRTLVLLKPDAFRRNLVGEIITRFERRMLTIVDIKLVNAEKGLIISHYRDIAREHGREVLNGLVKTMTTGPIVAIILEGADAISAVRKMVGATFPGDADPGTIRGDYAHMSKAHANEFKVTVCNLVHASANEADAEREMLLWFPPRV
ncbi:MAG TPA: nucleoside-diphosphate kinase [Verrucomicrobiae bacterium]|nr:nucleoside-diphosphate kinase [Verrucomicrobiae bacterium]